MIKLFTLLQIVPAATTQDPLDLAVTTQIDFIDLATKGGAIMWILLVMSIIAVFLFAERCVVIHRALHVDDGFVAKIRSCIVEERLDAAISLCQSNATPVARMIEKGIKRMGHPLGDIQTAIENVGNIEIARLEKGLPMLAAISGGAPMVGFLGTVWGMIIAFFNMSEAGSNLSIATLSGGIYIALVTTVAGLVVGLMAYFGYNYLSSRIPLVVHKLEAATIEFMDILYYKSDRAAAEPKRSSAKRVGDNQ
jgi:biopolymer transport protein ExbB